MNGSYKIILFIAIFLLLDLNRLDPY